MERRKSIRISRKFPVRFPSYNSYSAGTVTNLSEGGMFINAEICFPIQSEFEVLIPFKRKILKVPVKLVRFYKSVKSYQGMGVKITNSSKDYLEMIVKLVINNISH